VPFPPVTYPAVYVMASNMLIGYMRVSRSDGSQVLDLQRDALAGAGVASQHLYEDLGSGRRDDRPGLTACLKALRADDILDRKAQSCRELR
jgi:DNA invertase Pin-like site-specific DNA recombinase